MIRKYHNLTLQTNPRHLEEEPENTISHNRNCKICRCLTSTVRNNSKCLLAGAVICLFLITTASWSSIWSQYIDELPKVNYLTPQSRSQYIDELPRVNYLTPQLHVPYIYVVTPTYSRLVQKAELTRLSQTLRLVPNVHWILVEDSERKTQLVTNFLKECNLSYTHLNVFKAGAPYYERGVAQRNAGLKWIRKHVKTDGVVYFADDDNTYDVRIFEEMRYTKNVSVWPVGLISSLKAEGCIVKDGKVTGWFATFGTDRKYQVDMAGFAVNLRLIQDKPYVWWGVTSGLQESEFLSDVGVAVQDLEPKANNCTKVLVWHTQTIQASSDKENSTLEKYGFNSSLFQEV